MNRRKFVQAAGLLAMVPGLFKQGPNPVKPDAFEHSKEPWELGNKKLRFTHREGNVDYWELYDPPPPNT